VTELGVGERKVMMRIRQRLEMGQRQYGDLLVNLPTHNWRKEALEEALDLSIYLAVYLQQRDAMLEVIDQLLEEAQIDAAENAWQGVGVVAVQIRTLIDLKLLRDTM
jgi:hypothetical protein